MTRDSLLPFRKLLRTGQTLGSHRRLSEHCVIERELGPDSDECVITRRNGEKFRCPGLDLDEDERNPFANSDGFFPLLATLLGYPFPTIALLTGNIFGGVCAFSLAHNYRIESGTWIKPHPQVVARKMRLEAHRWTGKEALKDGIVDEIAEPTEMLNAALRTVNQIQ
ncbi:uncharacterized protein EI97DRAFT_466154 [Westerdykella ornata]|uniref:ClpP/crotonase n=1 Tax=Westerdykella ornata TaxID=318751 RepID=A0A6A6JSV0_WESOR|nr:uncharacterized protein EI97DRAFT_466154 [Westerdykella ornata]KAF2278059.1 hypothetical protein EI97DRAFT_466154 [Westerdykella ornata]